MFLTSLGADYMTVYFLFEKRGEIEIEGNGKMRTCHLMGGNYG